MSTQQSITSSKRNKKGKQFLNHSINLLKETRVHSQFSDITRVFTVTLVKYIKATLYFRTFEGQFI